jgi:hypothetical protein
MQQLCAGSITSRGGVTSRAGIKPALAGRRHESSNPPRVEAASCAHCGFKSQCTTSKVRAFDERHRPVRRDDSPNTAASATRVAEGRCFGRHESAALLVFLAALDCTLTTEYSVTRRIIPAWGHCPDVLPGYHPAAIAGHCPDVLPGSPWAE